MITGIEIIYPFIKQRIATLAFDQVAAWLEADEKSLEDQIQLAADSISISNLVASPYRQALMNISENDYVSAKKNVIAAIGNDGFNLKAINLYIKLLMYEKNYRLASYYYCVLLDCFGFRKDLVPLMLFEEYKKRFFSTKIHLDATTTLNDRSKEEPDEIWCSFGGIATSWNVDMLSKPWWEWITNYRNKEIIVYNWDYTPVLHETKKIIEVITNKYVVLHDGKGHYMVHLLKDGSLQKTLSYNEYIELFNVPFDCEKFVDKCHTREEELIFAGVRIKKDYKTHKTTHMAGGEWSYYNTELEKRNYMLKLSPAKNG